MRNIIVNFVIVLQFGCNIKIGYDSDEVLNSSLKESFLKSHNNLRMINNREPFVWDEGLAAFAKSWAVNLAKECRARKYSNNNYGENISQLWGSQVSPPSAVVRKWYDKKKSEYRQILWFKTQKVGCAYSLCNDPETESPSAIYVCEYLPRSPQQM